MTENRNSQVSSVRDIISTWDLPDPPSRDKYYLSSVYENLIGAGYGLLKAERENFRKRTPKGYNTVRLENELSKFCSSKRDGVKIASFRSQDWNTWLPGFYFGSGIHRIVWVSERLLAILYDFTDSTARTVSKKGNKKIKNFVSNGEKWLSAYKSSRGRDLPGLRCALASYMKLGQRDVGMQDETLLTVLHGWVNVQKHAAKGYVLTSESLQASEKTSSREPKPWRNLQADEKMDWAIKALRIVSGMYKDIHGALGKTIEARVKTKDGKLP